MKIIIVFLLLLLFSVFLGAFLSMPILAKIFTVILVTGLTIAVFRWLRLAKEGNAKALYYLGALHGNIWGRFFRDFQESFEFFRLSAERNYKFAQHNLGFCYANGLGTPEDYKKAAKWYTLAAEQGLTRSQFNLGLLYWTGSGVPEDEVIACMWIHIAAANGYRKAKRLKAKKLKTFFTDEMSPEIMAEADRLAQAWIQKNNQKG